MIEFFIYMGWMKVAEALLNPLGEDDDDLEVNSMLDKNLISGMQLVDKGQRFPPPLVKDKYWSHDRIDPLYSLSAAKRSVHPLTGSASNVNLVKDVQNITMIPHKSRLGQMDEHTRQKHIKVVSVEEHNQQFKQREQMRKVTDPDDALAQMRRRSRAPTANDAQQRDRDAKVESGEPGVNGVQRL
uniref:Bestrophin homolog n=1 Tax=Bursaphelenchus xylophilus TaxID=6326 RepID=A0A1I7RMC3_BURXY